MERRTVVKGAAWTMPAIMIAAAAPAVAASAVCSPSLTVLPGSYKCCAGGPNKTMYLRLLATDENGCGLTSTSKICVTDVRLANGQQISQVVGKGCVGLNGEFRINLLGVSSCSVNLLVDLTVDGQPRTVEIKSANIPGGTADQCGI